MPPEPRPATDAERDMVVTALRIVADISYLADLADREPTARLGCPPAVLRAAEALYVQAEQAAYRSRDRALLELVAATPRPDAP